MSTREHLRSVVTTLQPVVKGVPADHMGASTPCTEFDVRAVANHRIGTMEAMRRIGASEPVDAEDAAPFDKVLAQAGRDPWWSAT